MEGQIEYAELKNFYLDSMNPRLGRSEHSVHLSQEEVFDRMKDWSLEELAISFLESGFWAHEAVLCTTEEIEGEDRLVVIEGNRRVAALKRLQMAYKGEESSKRWLELIDGLDEPKKLFSGVPYIKVGNRSDVDEFLGFRHVTGIKEWAPPEKAQFIARLIDGGQLGYRDVMRKIGSTTPVVERNYVAFSILAQMETVEDLSVEMVKNRFSVLFLSLRSRDVQRFLGVEHKFGGEPKDVNPPIRDDRIGQLKEYSRWLFGDRETPPVVKDDADWYDHPIRSFLLLLSLFRIFPDWARENPDYVNQGNLFEEVVEAICPALLPGWDVFRAGWSPNNAKDVPAIVAELCQRIHVTGALDLTEWSAPGAKDAGLDIVCYRKFADHREALPVYFLQCASGKNWRDKLDTPNPQQWQKFMNSAVPPSTGIAAPFIIQTRELKIAVLIGQIAIFDRLRLLSAADCHSVKLSGELEDRLVQWMCPRIGSLPRAD